LHYQNNKGKIANTKAKHYQNNKEKIAQKNAEYYQSNKGKIAQRRAEYNKSNKEEVAKQRAGWYSKRNAAQPACVYQIVNSVSNKIYIGETIRGELRWKDHLCALRSSRHENLKLQADFDKFGEEAFEWSIIKEMDKDKEALVLEEIRTIDSFLKEGKELYNLSLTIDQLKLLQEDK